MSQRGWAVLGGTEGPVALFELLCRAGAGRHSEGMPGSVSPVTLSPEGVLAHRRGGLEVGDHS